MNTEKNSEAVRRARKELYDKVRNDWDHVLERALPHVPASYLPYQWTPEVLHAENSKAQQLADTARYPFRKGKLDAEERPYEGLLGFVDAPDTAGGDALDWRERTYAPSDPSSDEDESSSVNGVVGNILGKLGIGHNSSNDPSKAGEEQSQDTKEEVGATETNENEHSIVDLDHAGSELSLDTEDQEFLNSVDKGERKKLIRARRRRKRLEREMKWNDGLRYWEMRRDVWCCAKPRLPASSSASRNSGENSVPPSIFDRDTNTPTSGSINTNNFSNPPDKQGESPDWPQESLFIHENGSLGSHQSPTATQRAPPMLLPIAPPLLPEDDPTRAQITPNAYPAVYTKLVTRSLSPSVPLNLSVVVPSLVEGWKETGEWPTGTPADPTIYVDQGNGVAGKGTHHSGAGISALADATKNGLRALGSKASPGTSSRKSDAKKRSGVKAKPQLDHATTARQDDGKNQPSNEASHLDPSYHLDGAHAKSPSQESSHAPSRSQHTNTPPKSIFTSAKSRRSPNSTPDSPSPSRSTHHKQDNSQDPNSAGGVVANEPSSSKRVRKSVAKVGKALKDGFGVSSASGDGAGS